MIDEEQLPIVDIGECWYYNIISKTCIILTIANTGNYQSHICHYNYHYTVVYILKLKY